MVNAKWLGNTHSNYRRNTFAVDIGHSFWPCGRIGNDGSAGHRVGAMLGRLGRERGGARGDVSTHRRAISFLLVTLIRATSTGAGRATL